MREHGAAKCKLGATEILHEERARRRNAEGGKDGGEPRDSDRRLRAFRVIDEHSYQRIKSAAEVGRSKLKLRLS